MRSLRAAFVIGVLAASAVLVFRSQAGLSIVNALPRPLRWSAFSAWWALRPSPAPSRLRVGNHIRISEISDVGNARTLGAFKFGDELLERSAREGYVVTWWHIDYPLDAVCNAAAAPARAATRGCEVAAARRAITTREGRRALYEWLRAADWRSDPESLRFKVAELTGKDDFPERLPYLMEQVKKDVTQASHMGVVRPPVFTVNEKELDTDDPELLGWAVDLERRSGGRPRPFGALPAPKPDLPPGI